uniref:Uncharacterized protein n=1 Tax=Anguilla anguilla TaxID=7936 RepID=A0A0E9U9Z9_ANGAN
MRVKRNRKSGSRAWLLPNPFHSDWTGKTLPPPTQLSLC